MVAGWHKGRDHIDYLHRLEPILGAGADHELAHTVFELLERFCLLDITEISHELDQPAAKVAELYYQVKERRRVDVLLTGVSGLPRRDRWSALARLGLRDELYESIRTIVTAVLSGAPGVAPELALEEWERKVSGRLAKIEAVVSASRSADDLANLAVAARQIRTLALLTSQPQGSAPPGSRG